MAKSLAAAMTIGLIAIGLVAQNPHDKPRQSTPITNNEVGRFQLFFSPHARADMYLVDTVTGKIWKPTTLNDVADENLNSPPQLWVYQNRVDSEQEFDVWVASHKARTTPASAKQ